MPRLRSERLADGPVAGSGLRGPVAVRVPARSRACRSWCSSEVARVVRAYTDPASARSAQRCHGADRPGEAGTPNRGAVGSPRGAHELKQRRDVAGADGRCRVRRWRNALANVAVRRVPAESEQRLLRPIQQLWLQGDARDADPEESAERIAIREQPTLDAPHGNPKAKGRRRSLWQRAKEGRRTRRTLVEIPDDQPRRVSTAVFRGYGPGTRDRSRRQRGPRRGGGRPRPSDPRPRG